ncbi:MAG TPA: penicillin-binding transpeptidase domain-containing protein, partial [Thermopolyspora sp.]
MSERSRLRLVVLQVLIVSLLATLGGRLWFLQVVNAETYIKAADNTSLREVITPATRGLILDDQGRPLATNRTALVVSVSRAALAEQKDGGTDLITRVAAVIGKPFAEVWGHTRLCGEQGAPKPPDCWNGSPFQPIPVTNTASTQMALQIMEHAEDFPGVTAEITTIRDYPLPDKANAAHILGYLGPVTDAELEAQKKNPDAETRLQRTDLVGRLGLEAQYDDELRGTPGVTTVTIDRRNLVTGTVSEVAPTPGNYLVTSIDAKVQAVTEKALLDSIKRARTTGDPNKRGAKFKADSGAAVVLDVNTGRIVAMASYPTYDPNVWVGGISKKEYDAIASEKNNYPNQSRAFQGQFAPASTFKLISTPAAVEAGYSLKGSYPCPSAYPIGNSMKRNYESKGYGTLTFRRAIQVSCDTMFYKFAYENWLREGGTKAPL